MGLASLGVVGCGDDDAAARDAGGDDAGRDAATPDDAGGLDAGPPDAGPPAVVWEPCEIITGVGGHGAECATVDLPLDWAAPSGETIEVFVKRVRAGAGSRGQLWTLMGGPGGSV